MISIEFSFLTFIILVIKITLISARKFGHIQKAEITSIVRNIAIIILYS